MAFNTCVTYRRQVQRFCAWLATTPRAEGDPLREPDARDAAVGAYRAYLQTMLKLRPASVNATLAAIAHFYHFLGLPRPRRTREERHLQAPRSLDGDEQQRFLEGVDRLPLARDRALALLLFSTGLRLHECTALHVDDVVIGARKGTAMVRVSAGERSREVVLPAAARESLEQWLADRAAYPQATTECALFLTQRGQRLSARMVDLILRQLGRATGLTLSADILRQTSLTNLVRDGHARAHVAAVAGHKRLEATRRYCGPSAGEGDQLGETTLEGVRLDA